MSQLEEVERICDANWTAIRRAKAASDEEISAVAKALETFEDPYASVVVTGSVARKEMTAGSDFDWFLLVDGPSDPNHFRLALSIEESLRDLGIKEPGKTRTFGGMVNSHDLIHYIAGTKDTNENLTRRILLLLESVALTNAPLRERVVRNILSRYVVTDRAIKGEGGRYNRIPHFLLNDVVRYWRTIASDFASKMWERQNEGWPIRNIKLRFSRKLLFASGLLLCFAGQTHPPGHLSDVDEEQHFLTLLADFIAEETTISPLDKLARAAKPYPECAGELFGAYDAFLEMIGDPSNREVLSKLSFDDAATNEVYISLRHHSHAFRDQMAALFFDLDAELSALIRKLGVF